MQELTKNSVHNCKITGYSAEGSGIARIGGQVVFVKHALADEECSVKILKPGKTSAYGKVEEVFVTSPRRVEPACPVFGKCGGCDLMHMDYGEELKMKLQRVADAFSRIGGLDIVPDSISGAENVYHYRNKAVYSLDRVDGKAVAGFYRERSHHVVPAPHCLIQAEVSSHIAAAVCRWIDAAGASIYDEATGKGALRRIFCRHGLKTGETQVAIISAKKNIPDTDLLVDEVRRACPTVKSIVLNINSSRGNAVMGDKFITLWGSGSISDELCGLRFKLSPASFYQVNRDQAEVLYNKALEFAGLTGRETVLDLYCGTGTITLCLAGAAARVIGAEISEDAIRDAKENARINNISNVDFICADASEIAKKLDGDGLRPDVIVVDPPRKGLAPDVIDSVVSMSPDRVVYVSCDPATLARDLKLFTAQGYPPTHAKAVDLFPRTSHVECVVLMSREEK